MPSTVTHSYFIMDVYDKLPIKRKIFLKNEEKNLADCLDCLKEIADDVTTDVDQDGIWNALKKYGLL